MLEHRDLQFLELLRPGTQRCELENASKDDVAERQNKGGLLRDDGTGSRLYGPAPTEPTWTELMHPHARVSRGTSEGSLEDRDST